MGENAAMARVAPAKDWFCASCWKAFIRCGLHRFSWRCSGATKANTEILAAPEWRLLG